MQNQGAANDYAYYVRPTDNIPFPWLTVALAGSSEKRTCAGLYTETYGGVRRKCKFFQITSREFVSIYVCQRLWKKNITMKVILTLVSIGPQYSTCIFSLY